MHRLFLLFITVSVVATMGVGASPGYGAPVPVEVTIDLAAGPSNTFTPAVALGAGVDGHSRGDGDAIYRPATLRAMLSAGLYPLTYRLRTELAIEAWHWNPRGHWSDEKHARGYWTSDDRVGAPVRASFGYRLPRRGNTLDQAENNGYSRLADGDLQTFWKSNPYLDRRYTGEDNSRHPQWLIADLGKRTPLDAIRLVWGIPHAVRYQVQYWEGEDPDDPDEYPEGRWQPFPNGTVTQGGGGDGVLRLAQSPIPVRFLRVLMEESSGTAPAGARDPRDALGYAVREVYIGTLDATGRLQDVVRHATRHDGQTRFFVSSTDPWHRASDLDPDVEQVGIDRVFASGIARGLPMLVPVGVLYDTPDNAAALLRYLRRRGYPLRGVELGEEPDGQRVAPEDYGALYVRAANALRAVDPAVILGGPSFQSLWDEPMMAWTGTSVAPDQPWLTRWLAYLAGHDQATLGFLSFEWYPFDEVCASPVAQLQQASSLLTTALTTLYAQGLPRDTPLLMTEYGFSAFSTQAEVDLTGALFNADAVGTFLTQGGATAYLYGYEPSPVYKGPNCATWGNNTLFLSDDQRRILARTATYHGATLLARQWVGNPNQLHRVYPTKVETSVGNAASALSAYAIQRPDGWWAVLLVNQDSRREWAVTTRFVGPGPSTTAYLQGPAHLYQFSTAQYRWQAKGEQGRPLRSYPPRHTALPERGPVTVRLPPWSLTVIRGGGPRVP